MHTTGDGLVVPENEQAYRSVVDRAGNGNLLRQVFVNRAGHCAFTPAETITAVQTLENRISTGQWNVPSPAGMNAKAAALGASYNIFSAGSTVVRTRGLHRLHPGQVPAAVRPVQPDRAASRRSRFASAAPTKKIKRFYPTERSGWPAPVTVARHSASAAPIGVHGGPWTNGQISSAMRRKSAVADSSPRRANRPRLIRCRIT